MDEIFKQYGPPIIIVSVIAAFLIILGVLLSGNNSPVSKIFESLINKFENKANAELDRQSSTTVIIPWDLLSDVSGGE